MEYKINNISCSFEEYLVNLYLEELKDSGYIEEIIYQPESFQLFEGLPKKFYKDKQLKTKVSRVYSKKLHLLNPHIYTTDFKVIWNINATSNLIAWVSSKEIDIKFPFLFNCNDKEGLKSYLEIKGGFDRNGDQRLFTSRTQPWILEKYGIYIQMVKPFDLFKSTFIPKKAEEFMYYKKDTYTGKGKNRKLKARVGDKKYKFNYKTLEEYLNENNNNGSNNTFNM